MNIRNFVIISHIDHGKSTLADRLLEITGTVAKEKMRPQFLDMMDLEREKGITIKMQPVRMNYEKEGIPFVLNLIDTPGHVDFSYEVSRSLAAVEGAVLLVDATKGIQAQTLANLELARHQNLEIIAAVNKIDSADARVEDAVHEMSNLLNIGDDEIIKISAKLGTNVSQILTAVIEKVPPPKIENSGNKNQPFRALIFDSKFDAFKGVIAYVRVIDGTISQGEKIYLMATKTEGFVKEVGFFRPEFSPQQMIAAGEIGYIATGIKEAGRVRVGDTITRFTPEIADPNSSIKPLAGYREPKSMVFASLYPENPDDYDLLKDGLNKLRLNDAALNFEAESKRALGRGFRCGFLGTLHAEIIGERIRREFGLNIIVSTPQVLYKATDNNDKEFFIFSSSDWPDSGLIKEVQEPIVRLEVMTPSNYLGRVLELLSHMEAKYIETKYFGSSKNLLIYEMPLREVIVGFYDNLKGVTQGYASMNYEVLGFRPADLVKLDVLIAGRQEEAFSNIVPRDKAYSEGSKIVKKLKEVLPPQLFSVALQAAVGGKIIARETIRAKGKDVIAPLYGGDYTRKRKLLEIQKKGKKELKEKGEVKIPPRVFLEMLKR